VYLGVFYTVVIILFLKGCIVDPWRFCDTNLKNVSEIEIKTCKNM